MSLTASLAHELPHAGNSSSAQLSLMLTMASVSATPAYADVDDAVSSAVDSVKVRSTSVGQSGAPCNDRVGMGALGFHCWLIPNTIWNKRIVSFDIGDRLHIFCA